MPRSLSRDLAETAVILEQEGIVVSGGTRRAMPDEEPGAPSWSAEVMSEPLSTVIAEMLKPRFREFGWID